MAIPMPYLLVILWSYFIHFAGVQPGRRYANGRRFAKICSKRVVVRSPFSVKAYRDEYLQWRKRMLSNQPMTPLTKDGLFFIAVPPPGEPPCGTPGASFVAITKGEDAPGLAWPWQARVITMTSLKNGSHLNTLCGATLIAERWLLTAAHCVGHEMIVSLGRVSEVGKRDTFLVRAKVAKQIPHDGFTGGGGYFNDIALLKLASPVEFNSLIQPACLPKEDVDVSSPFTNCFISGYGKTHHNRDLEAKTLQQLRVNVMPFWGCKALWKMIGKEHLCLDFLSTRGAGVCQGDSGSPLSCLEQGGAFFVAGVASYVQRGCWKDLLPDVYTRVSSYISWIRDTIVKESGCLPPSLIKLKRRDSSTDIDVPAN